MLKILAILAEGFEEIETVTPIDLLRRAGAEVTLAALGNDLNVVGRSKITLRADLTLAEVLNQEFDCLLLPGGPGVKHLRADARVIDLVRKQDAAKKLIAAICAAPTVLHDAGVLTGRRYTAHFSVADELAEILADEKVVSDGHVLTSRGAGTALDFGLALIEHLFGQAKSSEIAKSICW